MKHYYFINSTHIENVRIDGDYNLIVSLQGRNYTSVKVLVANLQIPIIINSPTLRLNTYSGNGFSTNRIGVYMGLYEHVSVFTDDCRMSFRDGPTYHITPSLQELSFSILDCVDTILNPSDFDCVNFLLELDDEG